MSPFPEWRSLLRDNRMRTKSARMTPPIQKDAVPMYRPCLAVLSAAFLFPCICATAGTLTFPDAPPLYYDLTQTPPDAVRANIFLPKETKTVYVPPAALGKAVRFEARDDQASVAASGAVGETADIAGLGMGWYRIDFFDAASTALGWTTAAILPPLPQHSREDSPVAVDVALSWTPPDTGRDHKRMTEIAARTGVQWVRDRLRWR